VIPYRVCTLGPDGGFAAVEVLEAADDAQAVTTALIAASSFDVEIWDHQRFVARLPGTYNNRATRQPR
jgi:hypothetical protein